MSLYIKNMICSQCKTLMMAERETPGLNYHFLELGEVKTDVNNSLEKDDNLNNAFKKLGFEYFQDRKIRLVEKIKNEIINMVYYSDELPKIKNSVYISKKLNHDYSYLSNIFSEKQGTTIEQYIISVKIARVKDLLIHDLLNLSEIAIKLNYSSVAHLSYQFKKVTGYTPSCFKQYIYKKNNRIETFKN